MKIKFLLKKPPVLPFIIVGIIGISAVPSYYFYTKYQESQVLLKNPTEMAKEEVKTLVAQIGRHIELPAEEPTVATVSDREKLKNQPFFQKAQNGDKVLIFTQNRKAILYRPKTDKIIDISTVNVAGNTEQAVASAQVEDMVKLALYNGTTKPGLASNAEKQLKNAMGNVEIVSKRNALKSSYTKTLVIDVNNSKSVAASQVAALLQGELATLPEDEVKPEGVDVMVILGQEVNN